MNIREEVQPVVYRLFEGKIEFLIIKRWDDSKNEWHYRLIKGGVEEGESQTQAVTREALEEVGIKNLIIGKQIDHYKFTSGDGITHDVCAFLVECKTPIDSKQKLQNDGEEKIKEIEWHEKDRVIELLQFGQEKEGVAKAAQALQA